MLLGQEFKEQASGMKGSSFTTVHEPLERITHLVTLMVKTIPPKVFPEICRKQRKDHTNHNRMEKHKNLLSGQQPSVVNNNGGE